MKGLPEGRRSGESQDDCVSRHMASEEMKKEFPDAKQRIAVAISKCKASKEKLGLMLSIPSPSLVQFEEVELESQVFLKVTARAIAPGPWKGWNWPLSVVQAAGPLYEGKNIVENHILTDAQSVKGFITKWTVDDEGVVVEFLVKDPETIAKIKMGEFTSVSTNTEVNGIGNDVTLITKIKELTLTATPACKVCDIMEIEDKILPLSSPPTEATLQSQSTQPACGCSTSGSSEPPVTEATRGAELEKKEDPKNKPASVSLEAQNVHLSERIQLLETQNSKLTEAVQVMLDARKQETAHSQARDLVKDGRIAPCQEESTANLLLSMAPEQQETFKVFLSKNKVKPLGGAEMQDVGQTVNEKLPTQQVQLSDEQINEILLSQDLQRTDLQWKQWGGDGHEAQRDVQKMYGMGIPHIGGNNQTPQPPAMPALPQVPQVPQPAQQPTKEPNFPPGLTFQNQ